MDQWQQILEASDLDPQNDPEHDLLDGFGPKGLPWAATFKALCREEGCKGWRGVDRVIKRMATHPDLQGLRLPDEAVDWIIARDTEEQGIGKIKGPPTNSSMRRNTYSMNWGTPIYLIAFVRDVFGDIDLDLASSSEHNKIVGARRFYSAEDPCPAMPQEKGVVWCNPPGPRWSVEEFWASWCYCLGQGAQGAFLIFNADHWRALPKPPGECFVVVLRKRVQFNGAKSSANFPSVLVMSKVVESDLGHVVKW